MRQIMHNASMDKRWFAAQIEAQKRAGKRQEKLAELLSRDRTQATRLLKRLTTTDDPSAFDLSEIRALAAFFEVAQSEILGRMGVITLNGTLTDTPQTEVARRNEDMQATNALLDIFSNLDEKGKLDVLAFAVSVSQKAEKDRPTERRA